MGNERSQTAAVHSVYKIDQQHVFDIFDQGRGNKFHNISQIRHGLDFAIYSNNDNEHWIHQNLRDEVFQLIFNKHTIKNNQVAILLNRFVSMKLCKRKQMASRYSAYIYAIIVQKLCVFL
eukprot:245813_1